MVSAVQQLYSLYFLWQHKLSSCNNCW